MHHFHGLAEWVTAVFEHWHGWVSGGVLAFVLEVGDRLKKWEIKPKTFAVILGIGLLWSVFASWRDEHRNTEVVISEKASAWSQYNQCDKERAVDDTLAKSCSSSLAYQQSRNDGQQDLFNRCVLALGLRATPESTKVDVYRWKFPATYTYPSQGQVQFWVLVAITNKPTPAKGDLRCDTPFKALTSTLLTHGNGLRADYEQRDSKTVHVEWVYPIWNAANPLVFDVYTPVGQEIDSCSFILD